MRKIFTAFALAVLAVVTASAQVYVAGGFNGWNPKQPLVLKANAEGVYEAVIDFSKDNSFKMSTVIGTTGNGWTEFDTGTLAFATSVVANQWLPIVKKEKAGNITAPEKAVLTLQVDLQQMVARFVGNSSDVHAYSGTLPVLFINTVDNTPVTSKETYVDATYYIDPMGDASVKAVGTADAPLTMQIRGRGNYTWTGFDKKPYRIKLADKQKMLGMNSSKHWALLAHADDNLGFTRNTAGFGASQLLGMPWTPGQRPVEVVLNGDYIGLYFLTETVRVAKDRVNVVEQADEATTDVDGGWLVEIDNYNTDPHVTVYEDGAASQPIWFTYKSPEILSAEQSNYLKTQMQAVDAAVYYADKTDIGPLSALVDIDVLARFYIVQELLDDTESFHGSCYLSRQRGEAEKWNFGPVWDFGNAFRRGDSNMFIWQNPTFRQVWIGSIYAYPAFQQVVKDVWAQYLDADGPAQLQQAVGDFADRIATAAIYDAVRWPSYGNADEASRAASMMRKLTRRTEWLKTQWGAGGGVSDIAVDNTTKVWATGGAIMVWSSQPTDVDVVTPSGVVVAHARIPADNVVRVDVSAPGLYFVAGTKVLVRR